MRHRPQWRKLALIALGLAALGAAWRYTPLRELFARDEIWRWAMAMRETWWAAPALVLAYAPAAFVLFPRTLLTVAAVVAFGVWTGVACAVAGVMLAALATYAAGRILPPGAIFALNMAPTPPFVVQGMVAGAVRVNAWHYALGSFLGALPALLALTVFGEEIAGVLQGSAGVRWWLVAAALFALVLSTYLVRRWFVRQASAEAVG